MVTKTYSKLCLKWPLKKTKNWFSREHSAILLTFIKLPFGFKTFVLSIFERLFKGDSNLNDKYFNQKELKEP